MSSENREDKFTTYWKNAKPVVSSYILSMIPNRSDHDDILQNTAISALKKFDKYDESRPFTKWALGFAKYEILANKRKYARNPIIFQETLIDSIMEICYEMEEELSARTKAFQECVTKLPKNKLEILKMRYKDILSYDNIANILNTTQGAIRTQINRVKTALHKCIAHVLSIK